MNPGHAAALANEAEQTVCHVGVAENRTDIAIEEDGVVVLDLRVFEVVKVVVEDGLESPGIGGHQFQRVVRVGDGPVIKPTLRTDVDDQKFPGLLRSGEGLAGRRIANQPAVQDGNATVTDIGGACGRKANVAVADGRLFRDLDHLMAFCPTGVFGERGDYGRVGGDGDEQRSDLDLWSGAITAGHRGWRWWRVEAGKIEEQLLSGRGSVGQGEAQEAIIDELEAFGRLDAGL